MGRGCLIVLLGDVGCWIVRSIGLSLLKKRSKELAKMRSSSITLILQRKAEISQRMQEIGAAQEALN